MTGSWQQAQMAGQGMYGFDMLQQTLGGNVAERIAPDFVGLATGAYRSNGVIFSCMLLRASVFSTIRFQYQRLASGRPSAMFGDASLSLLEEPWPGGTTQDLLARIINDADLAGNPFHYVETNLANLGGEGGKELVRLRPDWVQIARARRESRLGFRKIGYSYCEGGLNSGNEAVSLLTDEVA